MGFYGFYYYDWTYLLVIIGALLSIFASAKVNSTYSKYSRIRSASGLTGAETAERILHSNGIYDVSIERVAGSLTDHYDPGKKVLRLSDSTYGANSVAAVAVAAHECGHAIQHKEAYLPLKIRSAIVPVANFGSQLGIPIILIGLLLGSNQVLIQIGIWLFSLAVLFQVVTLPVEFNASHRALNQLECTGILGSVETGQSKKVLSAAAMTYVAAAATAILQLLRLILLFGRRNDD